MMETVVEREGGQWVLGAKQMALELQLAPFGLGILIWHPDMWLRPGRMAWTGRGGRGQAFFVQENTDGS